MMKKGLVVLLVFGLLLTGVTPALANGYALTSTGASAQVAGVQAVLPNGEELTEAEASEVEGALGPFAISVVARVGARILLDAATGAAAAAGVSYIENGKVSWRGVVAGAVSYPVLKRWEKIRVWLGWD